MKDPILTATGICVRFEQNEILNGISLSLNAGDAIAITGASGSGKTTLGRILAGQLTPHAGDVSVAAGVRRLFVEQQDQFFSLAGQRSTYYGQRYENQGMENCPTVSEFLSRVAGADKEIPAALKQMEIEMIAERKLLQLSNGERKRTQIAAALLQKPDLLILDQPFTGLDVHSRENLSNQLATLQQSGTALVLICDPAFIPETVKTAFELSRAAVGKTETASLDERLFKILPPPAESFETIVEMKNVSVQLGGKQILKNINWTVRAGERWVLQGHNGAGKTTLLSLITADNPQGYVNDLTLFDRRRGSGESIWDIKKRIGFVSPELHLYFLRGSGIFNTIPGLNSAPHETYDSLSCMDVITSGFNDEIGFSSPPDDHQLHIAETWLAILNLNPLLRRLFIHASLGEQRALLLARALVKTPALLILDEPCQGLDSEQTARFITILNQICQKLKTTLIYVTHRKEEIPDCITRQMFLNNGNTCNI